MPSKTQTIGHLKEKQALLQLKAEGLQSIMQNYHCKMGEIDLIMKDKQAIVFIEVRMRSHQAYGHALESIVVSKQIKIIHAAAHFLKHYPFWQSMMARFDVITFDDLNQTKGAWIKDAFRLEHDLGLE
jgi:putative endonuclease